MKIFYCIIYLSLFSFAALAKVELISPREVINQGSIVKGALRFKGDDLTKVSRLKLSNIHLSGSLYISNSGSVMRTDGVDYLDIPVTFTFTKVPETSILETTIKEEKLEIDISGIRIQPNAAADQLILEDFTIPLKKEWGIYLLIGIITLLLLGGGMKVFLLLRSKREKKKNIEMAKERVLKANDYESITQVWQDRVKLIELFPHAEKSFREFENVYFQFAFKPTRTEEELGYIRKAYEGFTLRLEGGESGI